MAITSGDILFKLSVKTGSAGDSTSSTPAGSLGKYVSTSAVSGTPANNVFDDVTGDENAASDVEYRCIFVHNNHATLTLVAPVVWISVQTSGGADIAVGVDPAAASAKGASSAQAAEIANEGAAPAGVSFSTPTNKAAGLALGDIGPGQVKAIWFRRTAANNGAKDDDGWTWRVEGDTAA